MNTNGIYQTIISATGLSGWVIQIFIVVTLTLIFNLAESLIYRFLAKRFENTKNVWDGAVLDALHPPLSALILLLGLSFAVNLASHGVHNQVIFDAVEPVRKIGMIAIITWFLFRLVSNAESQLVSVTRKFDQTTVQASSKLIRAAIIITSVLVGMQSVGLNITGLVAFGGVGTAIVGLAAQDVLANFFGGMMLNLDRPFAVGDWVRSPDREIEGTVETIGWRLCRIRTFDKRPLYVPNSVFSKISVENPSRMLNRRIYTNIGIRYEDATKMAVILKDIETMLRNHPEIDTNQTLMVNLVNFAPSSLEFMIYTFTKTTNWVKFQAVQQDVFLKIIDIIDQHGAEIAYPTSTVHVPDAIAMQTVNS